MCVHERAVDEVPPVGEQLVVVPAHELVPREVRVLGLRSRGREVVPQRVGVVAREKVAHPDGDVAARRRLASLHGEEFARHDVVRELQVVAVAEEHRRPDHRVEDDVVLAHEVEVARVVVLPPLAPRVRRPAALRPLDARGEVADDGVEPDVDALRVLRVARHRNGHAPIDVARHRARLQVPDEAEGEVAHVRAPVRLRRQPLLELGRERGQVEKQVRRLAELRRGAVDDRPRIDEVDRVELVPAVVALVAARVRVLADRARTLDVPVGQRAARRGGERPECGALDEVALVVERPEDVLRDLVVVARRRACERVEREPQANVVVEDERVVAIGQLTGRHALSVRRHHHGSAVLVRPAHHEDVVAFEPVIAGEDVGRHARAGDVAQVPRSARIRPCDRYEDLLRLRQGALLRTSSRS